MARSRSLIKRAAFAAGLAAAVGLAVWAAATTVLEYKMPKGRALTYESKSEQAQVMTVMGQSVDTNTTSASTFTFTPKGSKDKNFLLGVTVDDMSASVTSSQGDMSPDLSSVKGKSFDMVLSPLGAEVDVSGAEAITYSVATEERNIASGFKTFFPDLPGKPIKVGDTWPSSVGVEEKMTSMTIRIDLQNVNTLEGFEKIDGTECARISAQVTGTISGSGSQMGQDLTFSGSVKGKDTYYFAVKEGFYVKASSESTSEISIDVPAQSMTIPMTQTTKSEVKLTKKS
jgi:hypothetical protein